MIADPIVNGNIRTFEGNLTSVWTVTIVDDIGNVIGTSFTTSPSTVNSYSLTFFNPSFTGRAYLKVNHRKIFF